MSKPDSLLWIPGKHAKWAAKQLLFLSSLSHRNSGWKRPLEVIGSAFHPNWDYHQTRSGQP